MTIINIDNNIINNKSSETNLEVIFQIRVSMINNRIHTICPNYCMVCRGVGGACGCRS